MQHTVQLGEGLRVCHASATRARGANEVQHSCVQVLSASKEAGVYLNCCTCSSKYGDVHLYTQCFIVQTCGTDRLSVGGLWFGRVTVLEQVLDEVVPELVVHELVHMRKYLLQHTRVQYCMS